MNGTLTTLKQSVQEYLQTYLLKHVWNTPKTEFRQNIDLRLLSSTPSANMVIFDDVRIALPAPGLHYVYDCPIQRIIGVYPSADTWTTVETFVNATGLDLRFHGPHGEWLYRKDIYIKTQFNTVLIIIPVKLCEKFIHGEFNPDDIYLSLYRQPDSVGKLSIKCVDVTTNALITDVFVENAAHDIVYINGREANPISTRCIPLDSKVELIKDPDILTTITIAEDDLDNFKTFIDPSDNKEKLIIHIPKEYNSENLLITHNTCDIYIRPKQLSNITDIGELLANKLSGAFISRVDTEDRIGQITHNDFYIDCDLLNDYKATYGYDTYELRVIVRRAGKSDKLIQDRNYMEVLYQLSDEEILNFLSGSGDPAFPFWKAEVLANNPYVKTMYAMQKPTTSDDLSMYLEMFGYLACLNLVCARVQRYTITKYFAHALLVSIPLTLLNAPNIRCHVSIDGIKIPDDQYTTIKTGRELTVSLDDSVRLPVGKSIIFELFEQPELKAEYFTPVSGAATLNISGDVKVYRVRTIGSGDSYTKNKLTENYTVTKSYELITSGYSFSTTDTTKRITFESSLFNSEYLVISDLSYAHATNEIFNISDLANDIVTSDVLTTTATKWSDNTEIAVPILTNNVLVYLNGYELVKNIDYSIMELKSNGNKLIGYVVNVSSIDYLKNANNILDVYAITEEQVAQFSEFVHNRVNESVYVSLLWLDNLNMLTADGQAVPAMQHDLSKLTIEDDIARGALMHSRVCVPLYLQQIFQAASTVTGITFQSDYNRCLLLADYLKQTLLDDYEVARVEKSHNLYSLVMTKILKDYLGGTLVVSPGDNLNTKLAKYLAVVDYDLALQNNKLPIIVSRSGDPATNGTYTIVDNKKRDLERVWSLGNNRIQYDTSSYRWVLTKSSVVVFSSSVCVKPYDPWLLLWESATPGVAVPVIDSEGIDLRYIDVFPSYRTYDLPATSSSGYVAKYNLLKSITNLVFPTDKIQDGVTVS